MSSFFRGSNSLDEKMCEAGSDLIFGPLPLVSACNSSMFKPLIYQSAGSQLSIEYIKGPYSENVDFELVYVSSK